MEDCKHRQVLCLNHYEIIRKYRCKDCREVMMCKCDEDFARMYLPHQLHFAQEQDSRSEVAVTIGFQDCICRSCRGLAEEAHPKAPLYGRTSKVHRLYWREILMRTIQRFGKWACSQGYNDWLDAQDSHPNVYKALEKEVVEEIKKEVQSNDCNLPKYICKEESQQEVIIKNQVKTIPLYGEYIKAEGKSIILDGQEPCAAEDFAAHYFERQGYKVLFTESSPFHAIFAIYMWQLIQDPLDPSVRMTIFGRRDDPENRQESMHVYTLLPSDFGVPGYSLRRADVVREYFSKLPSAKDDFLWIFDYWVGPSSNLRQYLWAHRTEDINKAREIISILPTEKTLSILRYLLGDYWKRHCGWPDLLVHRDGEFFFAEVKSSKDKLSEDQKRWIQGNREQLQLPFCIVKIHRQVSRSF